MYVKSVGDTGGQWDIRGQHTIPWTGGGKGGMSFTRFI